MRSGADRRDGEGADETYGDDVPLLVGVLNGAITFMTDLMRQMTIPLEVDFMAVSSYGAATQSSVVRILKDPQRRHRGRQALLLSKTSWTAVSPCSTCLMCCSGGTP